MTKKNIEATASTTKKVSTGNAKQEKSSISVTVAKKLTRDILNQGDLLSVSIYKFVSAKGYIACNYMSLNEWVEKENIPFSRSRIYQFVDHESLLEELRDKFDLPDAFRLQEGQVRDIGKGDRAELFARCNKAIECLGDENTEELRATTVKLTATSYSIDLQEEKRVVRLAAIKERKARAVVPVELRVAQAPITRELIKVKFDDMAMTLEPIQEAFESSEFDIDEVRERLEAARETIEALLSNLNNVAEVAGDELV